METTGSRKGAEHDSTELLKKWKGGDLDILIEVVCTSRSTTESGILMALQGTGDNFYKQGQLLPENFAAAAKEVGQDKGINIRYQPDYDHSYFTMATFADEHVAHAAKYLGA